jgi:hypothetical protein
MKCLTEVAIQNVLFLSQRDKFLANRYNLSSKEFVEEDSDSFDTIYSFAELEYPLYVTFHQVMNHVHSSYEHTIYGHTRKELLDHMVRAVDTLVEYYDSVDDTDESFEELLNDLDDKVHVLYGYYKYGWCMWLPTKVKELVNYGCNLAITTSREIIKGHMQDLRDPGWYMKDLGGKGDADDKDDVDYDTDSSDTNDDIPTASDSECDTDSDPDMTKED